MTTWHALFALQWIDWLNGYFNEKTELGVRHIEPSQRLPDFGQMFVRSVASVHFYSQMVSASNLLVSHSLRAPSRARKHRPFKRVISPVLLSGCC